MDLDLSGPPRRRYFRWRANEKAGREGDGSAGAFNGQCLVYEGDEFFMELRPVLRTFETRDPATRKVIKTERRIVMQRQPTWADPLEEYEPPEPPRLVKTKDKVVGHIIPAPQPLSSSPSHEAAPKPLRGRATASVE